MVLTIIVAFLSFGVGYEGAHSKYATEAEAIAKELSELKDKVKARASAVVQEVKDGNPWPR